ncbi:MAG: SDR family oxidoreductase [Candidatus Zixiibacteriota bacterium]|nr:MAG: SDR family oxidoreductase [candidate division Zixibacteria bacterium]
MDRCLITGASRGIGRAIAVKLAGSGYQLLLHGRDLEALEQTSAAVADAGGQAQLITADLASQTELAVLIDAVGDKPLKLLVNNAGVACVRPFEEISRDDWLRTLAVNVTAPFLLTQKLVPLMREGASIVNLLSVAARTGFPNWSSYCMSKFALEGLMQSIREELRPRKIRVVNIYPSATKTAMWSGVEGEWPVERMISPEEVAEAVHYAINRPSDVLVENISVGNISGTL